MKQLSLLSDEQLLIALDGLARAQRTGVAQLVAHLAELDARRSYLDKAFGSLFVYRTKRLGFSEDEACRRIDAARLLRAPRHDRSTASR